MKSGKFQTKRKKFYQVPLTWQNVPNPLKYTRNVFETTMFQGRSAFFLFAGKEYPLRSPPKCPAVDRIHAVTFLIQRLTADTQHPGCAWYTNQVIDRVGICKSDAEILQELAIQMQLGDELLERGYEDNIRRIIRDLDVTVEQLRANDTPLQVPGAGQPPFGAYREGGMDTLTGKYELFAVYDGSEFGAVRVLRRVRHRLHGPKRRPCR